MLPLIKCRWVHCIIHQAFLSTVHVFLFHTLLPKQHSLNAYRPFSSAAGTWHSSLSLHSYYLVAVPTNVKKCYECGDMFAKKFRQPPHNTVVVVKHLRGSPPRQGKGPGNEVGSLGCRYISLPSPPPVPFHPLPSFSRYFPVIFASVVSLRHFGTCA